MFTHGHKVESAELRRSLASHEAQLIEAQEVMAILENRVLHTERALLAATRTMPQDQAAMPGERARLHLAALPSTGTEMLGTAIVTERASAKTLIAQDAEYFMGVKELLIPGAFWSVVSDLATLSVEARISPAYVMPYNEIVVPIISGAGQQVTLHHAGGSDTYGATRATTTHRLSTPREWNGRITVQSQASFKVDGKYIHAGAAPFVYNSVWADSGTVRAEKELNATGTLTPYRVLAMPGETPLEDVTFLKNGTSFTGSTSVVPGDVLAVTAALPWNVAASYVAVTYTLVS